VELSLRHSVREPGRKFGLNRVEIPSVFPMGTVPFLLHFFLIRIAEKESDIILKDPGFVPSHSSLQF